MRPPILVAVLVLAVVGCGGSSSPTSPPTNPPPVSSIAFTEDAVAGANSIFMTAPDGQRLRLEVRTNSVGNLYGVSFDLTFPSGQLNYVGVTEGSFLAAGGNSTSLQVAETEPGRLVVGLSRLGSVGGAGGSGLLATFEFTAAGTGGGALRFVANSAFNSSGGVKSGVTWVAGSVQVTQ